MSEAAKWMRQTHEVTGDRWFLTVAEEIERLQIEIAAISIYNEFPYDGPDGTTKPAWVPFGNSIKQQEARDIARRKAIAVEQEVKK